MILNDVLLTIMLILTLALQLYAFISIRRDDKELNEIYKLHKEHLKKEEK